jgi:hypothetical protein
MKVSFIYIIIIFFTYNALAQQAKVVTGRIIDEFSLEPIPQVTILNTDTVKIGATDINGYFKIDVPPNTNKLFFSFIGFEFSSVSLNNNCQVIEVVLMYGSTHDFTPIKNVNKERWKRFKRLPKAHKQAYKKGVFKSKTPCFNYIFNKS